MKEISDYKIDYAKTIVSLNNFVYYLAYEDNSFYKYYHSKEKTEKFQVTILVFSKVLNSIINKITFSISKNDYVSKNIELLYCAINNVGFLIQETINSDSKIVHILYCDNLESEQNSYFYNEPRVHKITFSKPKIEIVESVKGKSTLRFIDSVTKNYSDQIIFNISKHSFMNSILSIALGNEEWRENGYDEWRNTMNVEAEKEIKKYDKRYEVFLPFVFFREDEWLMKKLSYNEESFRNIVDKIEINGEPTQEIKDDIIKRIRIENVRNRSWKKDDDDELIFPSSKSWLADAAGTNDSETMNDVFWNLD